MDDTRKLSSKLNQDNLSRGKANLAPSTHCGTHYKETCLQKEAEEESR